MVRLLLTSTTHRRILTVSVLLISLAGSGFAADGKPAQAARPGPPELLLEGGRKLSFERSFSSESEVKNKPGFWTRVANFVAGPADVQTMVAPYAITIDSQGRAIVTDPGAMGVHIFDLARRKYRFVEHADKGKDSMRYPQCVAVDSRDNLYVTDSQAGKIFVFSSDGRFKRVIGSLNGGEGFFKRPTGIAIDRATQRIYVTDTLRNAVFLLDNDGTVLQRFGKTGSADGEFNYPTALLSSASGVAVVDAMNFRIQFLDLSGQFRHAIGTIGDTNNATFRPKAVSIDSEGHYYVVEALWGMVQVFDEAGELLYYFGRKGTGFGDFQLPTGIAIDAKDEVFVVDSFNRRVQVFRYQGMRQGAGGQP